MHASSRFPESVERRLLVAAAIGDLECVGETLREPIRWDRVLDHAARHRLLGLLDRSLARAAWPNVAARLAEARAVGAAGAAREAALVARVAAALGPEVPFVVLKGAALGASLYGAAHVRAGGLDVDALIDPRDLDRAVPRLETAGFEPIGMDALRRPSASRGHTAVFASPGGRAPALDLHWAISEPLLGVRDRGESARWERETVDVSGVSVPVLAPAGRLVAVALHAHHHGFFPALLLADVAVAASDPRCDLDRARALAARVHARVAFDVALAAAAEFAGTRADDLVPAARRRWSLLRRLGLNQDEMLGLDPWWSRAGADRVVAALATGDSRAAARAIYRRLVPEPDELRALEGAPGGTDVLPLHARRVRRIVRGLRAPLQTSGSRSPDDASNR